MGKIPESENSPIVTSAFNNTLRQLSPPEVTFLVGLFEFLEQPCGIDPASSPAFASRSIVLGTDVDLLIKYLKLGLGRPTETRAQALRNIPGDLRDFMAMLDHLERLKVLFYRLEDDAPGWGKSSEVEGMDPVRIYHLTALGQELMRACRHSEGTAAIFNKKTDAIRKPN